MLKVQRYSSIFTPGVSAGRQEAGDAACIARLAAGAGKQRAVGGGVHAGGPHLLAVDQPAVHAVAHLAHRRGLHVGGVTAVVGFGQAEGDAGLEGQLAADELLFLCRGAEVAQHHDDGEVAHHRMLVLQVVEQAQALAGEVVADHAHPQVADLLAAEFLGQATCGRSRPCRRSSWPAAAAPPTRAAAGPGCRSRCAPIHGGGRRSARCRPAPAAA